jgi:hypothetical protein
MRNRSGRIPGDPLFVGVEVEVPPDIESYEQLPEQALIDSRGVQLDIVVGDEQPSQVLGTL